MNDQRARSTMHSLSAILDGRMQAFPADYRGVAMRSQLEADFAHHLDVLGIAWEYEPRPFTDGDGRGYLPDFRVTTKYQVTYFEVKPTVAEVPLARKRMQSIWREEPDATLIVACGEGCRFWSDTKDGSRQWVERWRH